MAGYLIGGRLVAGGGLDAGEVTLRAIPADGSTLEMPLNEYGTIDVNLTVPLVDPVTGATVNIFEELVPGRDYLGWVEDGTILEAGPVWGDPFEWSKRSRIVAAGIWSYFNHRYVLPVLTAGELPRDVTSKWEGLSLRTIAKRLVQQACSHPAATLPIDYEPDVTGTHQREYPGSDMKKVGEALTDLTQVEGGPDIMFRPKWGADRKHVRWDLVTGDPEITQGGSEHYWDTSVPDAHASVVSIERDGAVLGARDFQLGDTLTNLLRSYDPAFTEDIDGIWTAGGSNGTIVRASVNGPGYGLRRASRTTWSGSSGNGASGVYLRSDAETPYLALEPGKTYRLSVFAHASTTKPMRLMVQIKDDEGAYVSPNSLTVALQTLPVASWQRITGTFTVPEGVARVGPFLYPQSGHQWASGNVLYTTGWMLTEGESEPPFAEEDIQLQAVASSNVLTEAGFPLLETMTNRSSVVLDTTLQAYANESVTRNSAHLETWTLRVRRDKHPKLGAYLPGDYLKVVVGRNARVPAGTYRLRIVTMTCGKTGPVTIKCAPERVASGYPVPSSSRTWFRDQLHTLSAAVAENARGNK